MRLLTKHFFAEIDTKDGGFFEIGLGRLHITFWTPYYWMVAIHYRQIHFGPVDVAWWDAD